MTAAELQPELRNLIDARLEAIDRILAQARVAWAERRNIVGEVETQIYELLARRTAAPAEDDVLAVLGTLDPAEAYIPEELRGGAGEGAAPVFTASPPRTDWRRLGRELARHAARFASGAAWVGGLVVANGLILGLIVSSDGVIPWVVTLGCLAWLNYSGIRWYRVWSAARQGSVIDELRYGLSAWLMPKNGAAAG